MGDTRWNPARPSGAGPREPIPTWIEMASCALVCVEFEDDPMRTLALTILTMVIVLAAGDARAGSDSYCLQGRQWGYPGNCQFSSYAQCMATASGTDAYCGINPQAAFARQRRGAYRNYRNRY